MRCSGGDWGVRGLPSLCSTRGYGHRHFQPLSMEQSGKLNWFRYRICHLDCENPWLNIRTNGIIFISPVVFSFMMPGKNTLNLTFGTNTHHFWQIIISETSRTHSLTLVSTANQLKFSRGRDQQTLEE